jgi:hypothetical protein
MARRRVTDPAILEAAARALRELRVSEAEYAAVFVLDIVTPLIRAAALEEAAVIAESEIWQPFVRDKIAARIRALAAHPADAT